MAAIALGCATGVVLITNDAMRNDRLFRTRFMLAGVLLSVALVTTGVYCALKSLGGV